MDCQCSMLRLGSSHACCPNRLGRPPRCLRRVLRFTASSATLVKGPPAGYDYRSDIQQSTVAVVQAHFPQLEDLVRDGTLIVYQRPADYTERRTDGYQEPELIFVVGTAHVSRRSAADVQRVVQAVCPKNVVVELCKSRVALLQNVDDDADQLGSQDASRKHSHAEASTSNGSSSSSSSSSNSSGTRRAKARNPLNLSGSSNVLAALQRSMVLGGQSALLLRLLLASQAGRAASKLGVEAGLEFRAAARAADAVEAQLVLGDRPIEITLERAWAALSWRQRLQLCRGLLAASLAPVPEDLDEATIEALKSDDAVSAFFAELSRRYPELLGPLVHERDLYLAWSLKRSKAVNGTKRVVGVVGKGHLRGIVHALCHDDGSLRFVDLVGGRNSAKGRRQAALRGARRLALEALLGAGAYAAWLAVSGASQGQ